MFPKSFRCFSTGVRCRLENRRHGSSKRFDSGRAPGLFQTGGDLITGFHEEDRTAALPTIYFGLLATPNGLKKIKELELKEIRFRLGCGPAGEYFVFAADICGKECDRTALPLSNF